MSQTQTIELAKHRKLEITVSPTEVSLTSLERGPDAQYHSSQSLTVPLEKWSEIVEVVASE
jgi:hypothetical protein